jgi:pimeloyl-ACP methyl ester carboxylesterase
MAPMSARRGSSNQDPEPPPLTRWHESLYPVDLLLLHAAPIYYGVGVPPGDGSPVLMIPGFLHSDFYLVILHAWLQRSGYQPYYSGINLNAECPDLLVKNQLDPLIDQARKDTHKKIHLIGHSLGGIIARSIAAQRPADIASIITLGSPFPGGAVHHSVLRDSEVVRRFIQGQHGGSVRTECYTDRCQCDFMKSLHRGVPRHIPYTAVFTKNDGIVDWKSCRTGNPQIDVEVTGTHAGLAFNPSVYSTIALRLARK